MNAANEITGITGGWVTPEYDDAGNMKAMPLAGTETDRLLATYDAWNRQRKAYLDDGDGEFEPSDDPDPGPDKLLVTYEYDASGCRIEKHTTAQSTVGQADVDYFYNQNWQLLQSETDAGGPTAVDQYVWSVTYVDAPVARFHDANGNGDYEDEATRFITIRGMRTRMSPQSWTRQARSWSATCMTLTARRPFTTPSGPPIPNLQSPIPSATAATSSTRRPRCTTCAGASTTRPYRPGSPATRFLTPPAMRTFAAT